jgi:hypothetical protein
MHDAASTSDAPAPPYCAAPPPQRDKHDRRYMEILTGLVSSRFLGEDTRLALATELLDHCGRLEAEALIPLATDPLLEPSIRLAIAEHAADHDVADGIRVLRAIAADTAVHAEFRLQAAESLAVRRDKTTRHHLHALITDARVPDRVRLEAAHTLVDPELGGTDEDTLWAFGFLAADRRTGAPTRIAAADQLATARTECGNAALRFLANDETIPGALRLEIIDRLPLPNTKALIREYQLLADDPRCPLPVRRESVETLIDRVGLDDRDLIAWLQHEAAKASSGQQDSYFRTQLLELLSFPESWVRDR